MEWEKIKDVLDAQQHGDESESFESYRHRVGLLLPNFPSEVLEDWLFRHGILGTRLHGWLDYTTFRFTLETLSSQDVMSVQTSNPGAVDSWRRGFQENPDHHHRLAQYIRRHGTWPVPPVVLHNAAGLIDPRGIALGPLHLLEGHTRLAYLQGLIEEGSDLLQSQHSVWLVRCPKGAAVQPG